MKKLSVIILIFIALVGCKKGNHNFVLSGKIDGLGSDTLYVYQFEGAENDLDTVVVKDGSFEYTLKVDTVTLLMLLINDSTEYPIYADKELDIQIKGKSSTLSELQIKGGKPNDELNEFRNSVTSSPLNGKELTSKAESFIRNHPGSIASIYILNKYFVQKESPDYLKINDLIKLLSVDLQDRTSIKELAELADKQINVAVGQFAPSFVNKDKDGKAITFSDFKDKYLFITFWATWWPDYTQEFRAVKAIRNKFKKEKLATLGVSLDVDRESWLEAIKRDTLGGIQVTDLQGWSNSIVRQYGIEKLPSNILIGPDRKIIAKNLDEKSVTLKLEELFK